MPDPPLSDTAVSPDDDLGPPIFATWRRFYLAILVWEALVVLAIAAVSAWPYRS